MNPARSSIFVDMLCVQPPSLNTVVHILMNLSFSCYCVLGEEVLAYESADYQRVHRTSLDYPEVFWSNLAKKLLVWRCKDFVTINCCVPETGHIEWFKEGKLNASGKLQIFGS